MGCLKLQQIESDQQPLRCVWKSTEYQKTDVNWYDYGARFYDPALGRFTTQDPLAEDFNSWTPYHYVHNNPINLVDPTGMSANGYTVDGNGDLELKNNEGGNSYDVIYSKSEYSEAKRKDYDETGDKTGLKISKGIVQSKTTVDKSMDADGNVENVDRFIVDKKPTGEQNDQEAQTIHQFLDQKTDVEWSVTYAENANGEGVAVLGTDHDSNGVSSSKIADPYLVNKGYKHNMRRDHNHPGGSTRSSTADRTGRGAQLALDRYPNPTFRILVNKKYYPYVPTKK